MSEFPELMSCPFCGGEPRFIRVSDGWCVECTQCCVQAVHDRTPEKIAPFWNKRDPSLATERAAREALQAELDARRDAAHRVLDQLEAAEAQLSALRSRCEGLAQEWEARAKAIREQTDRDDEEAVEAMYTLTGCVSGCASELRELLSAGDVRGLGGEGVAGG